MVAMVNDTLHGGIKARTNSHRWQQCNDRLLGGSGVDTLKGGNGNDGLIGGRGQRQGLGQATARTVSWTWKMTRIRTRQAPKMSSSQFVDKKVRLRYHDYDGSYVIHTLRVFGMTGRWKLWMKRSQSSKPGNRKHHIVQRRSDGGERTYGTFRNRSTSMSRRSL